MIFSLKLVIYLYISPLFKTLNRIKRVRTTTQNTIRIQIHSIMNLYYINTMNILEFWYKKSLILLEDHNFQLCKITFDSL